MNKNVKTALIVGGIAIFILIVVPSVWGAIAGWQGGSWGTRGPGMMGSFGGMGLLMPVFMVIFWALVIWAIVALIRGLTSSGGSGSSGQADAALEILKKRYAQGDINKQEFEEKKKDLAQ